ncbi:MAG TPA: ectonucleotide pyrophosphatase/phosphodiesterase [Ohtaekwangia sp.]|uniref:alkaline phosphatase family protein n=1 Tax=Ohtaekwangia sp. TaxID=2066019 RepID=UPI002F949189
MKRILLVCFCLLVWTADHAQQKQRTPYVILVSFDGFRYDYVAKFNPPNFKDFIKKGAAAQGLIPSFPSKTFPNHYTLVTGLYPGHHGLVDNQFYDPALRKPYGMKDKTAVGDTAFYGGIPLWQLAQQNGVHAASFFWVGSEAAVKGIMPDYSIPYDEAVPNNKRVDQTITWLKLRENKRPHFISLYFSLVDSEGHRSGTNSAELKNTVLKADSVLGYLMQQLKTVKVPVNVILVSDHGMYELKQDEATFIPLYKLYNIADPKIVTANGGTQAHIYTGNAGRTDSLYTVLKKEEKHFKVYKREETPVAWHYDLPRIGDLLVVAEPGYYIQDKPRAFGNWQSTAFGVHGYDPSVVKEMQGIFYAIGPNVKAGVTITPFENIHVYPFIAKILGLPIPAIDGDFNVLKPIYKK